MISDENSLQTKKEDLLTAIKISCMYETQEDQNTSTEISSMYITSHYPNYITFLLNLIIIAKLMQTPFIFFVLL